MSFYSSNFPQFNETPYMHKPPCCKCKKPKRPKPKKKAGYKPPVTPPECSRPIYEPCVHLHFKSETIDRECLTHDEYLDMLATPKGYPWLGEVDCCNPELEKNKRKKKKKSTKWIEPPQVVRPDGGDFADEFVEDMWDVMSPDITNRLVDFLVNEFGMSCEEAEDFIDCKAANGKNKTCKRKKSKPMLNLGPKHKWVKEFSDVFAKRIEQYIVSMLMTRRTPRVKLISERILAGLCDLTGEKTTLQNPKTKLQRTLVLISDRLALWIDDLTTDLDKPSKRATITEPGEEEAEESEKEKSEKGDEEKPEEEEEKLADEEEKPAEEEKPPEEEEKTAEEEEKTAEEEEKPAEEEQQPVEDEEKPADGEEKPTKEEIPEEEEKPAEKVEEPEEVEEKQPEEEEQPAAKEEVSEEKPTEVEEPPAPEEETQKEKVAEEEEKPAGEEEQAEQVEPAADEPLTEEEAVTEEPQAQEEQPREEKPEGEELETTEGQAPPVEEREEEQPAETETEVEAKPEEEVEGEIPEEAISEPAVEEEKVPEKKMYDDIFDILKEDIAGTRKTGPTDRQKAVKDVVDKRLEKILAERETELAPEEIDDAASRVAHWVERLIGLTEPKREMERKGPGAAFQVRPKTGSVLQVQKLSSGTVAEQTAKARGVDAPLRSRKVPATQSPVNMDTARDYINWMANAADLADEWGVWLESRLTDAEKQVGGKQDDWKERKDLAQDEALKWRVEKARMKDEAKKWGKKLEEREEEKEVRMEDL